MTHWHQLTVPDTLSRLETDRATGLTTTEVDRRRQRYGPNELAEGGRKSPWLMLLEQFTAPLVVMLIVAAAISAFLQDYKNAISIMAIVILNAVIGFRQEYSAEQAMAALKRLSTPTVKVRRDGQVREISSRELVPGDIVLLEAGNLVPADGRIVETASLRVQEAALTGESEAVEKEVDRTFAEDCPLGDRRNLTYMGTIVTYGRAAIAVTQTGMNTELGRIAHLIQGVESEQTPLQRRLGELGKTLGAVAVAISALIFILGLLRGEEIKFMFLTAVSLVVAAVPEGLPAVVTIALALGAARMLKRNALIRKLPAVETLGSVTTICSDKTGTLTKNRMSVTALEVVGERIDWDAPADDAIRRPSVSLLLSGVALCNDATLGEAGEEAIGDPTETALVVAAAKVGLLKDELEAAHPRIEELPFDSDRKLMTTLHRITDTDSELVAALGGDRPTYISFTKGAFDRIIDIASGVWTENGIEPFEKWRDRVSAAHDRLAEDGLRVLAVAFRPWNDKPATIELERDLVLVGLTGSMDPARPEVRAAIRTCQNAGIRAIMITGDHPLTAAQIAGQLGISSKEKLLTGPEIERSSVAELEAAVDSVSVYARVSPEHKLKIVEALQNRGHLVAMTGDGVNDAPALKKSEIGVAMGITGTDVAKEAADIVLQDDNFATIVAAVEEGRTIYDNIRKFIKYTLTGNTGELWVILLVLLLQMPLPLEPLQILWVNLIADGMLALALSVEPGESNVMNRRPYKPRESIFARGVGIDIIWIGLFLGFILFGIALSYDAEADLILWRTMIFSTLAFSRIGLVLALRSQRDSLFQIGLLSNKPLLGVVFLTFALQMLVLYVPFLQNFFGTTALSAANLGICLGLSVLVFIVVEVQKLAQRWRHRRS